MNGEFETVDTGERTRRSRGFLAGAIVAIALGLALTACGGGGDDEDSASASGPSDADLLIGATIPLSGGLESLGPAGQKAAELAVGQIEDAAATAGSDQTVELRVVDSQSDPAAAVDAARQLDEAGASCITGGYSPDGTIQIAQKASIPDGILQISPAATADTISTIKDRGLLNRTALPDSSQGTALASAVTFSLHGAKGKTVNIAARDDDYGASIADAFTGAWTKSGGVIGERVDYDVGRPSYNEEAEKITSGDPDAILIVDFSDNFPAVATALGSSDAWKPSIAWGSSGLANPALLDDPGPEQVAGMHVTALAAPTAAPETKAFRDLYKISDPTDVPPGRFDAQEFDAVVLCYLSSIAAGSTDGTEMASALQDITGPGGDKFGPNQLPAAIKALESGNDIDYVGASGPIDLDANGDPTAGAYDLFQFGADELKLVGNIPVGSK